MRETTLTFGSGGVRLEGTLSVPSRCRPKTCVLLFAGSGPQDRDESLAGHRPFHALARRLVAANYAVFRWDERGAGSSGGDYATASAADLAHDAHQALRCVAGELGLDGVVLAGHSQGCLIAAEVAATSPAAVVGLVLLAGMGRPGRVVLLEQHRRLCEAAGASPNEVRDATRLKARILERLTADGGGPLRDDLTDMLSEGVETHDKAAHEEIAAAVEDLLEWEWRWLAGVDPAAGLRRVACPVLALAGAHDLQIDAASDTAAIRDLLERTGRAPATAVVVPHHNHLFQVCDASNAWHYDRLGEPFTEEACRPLIAWLDGLCLSGDPHPRSDS